MNVVELETEVIRLSETCDALENAIMMLGQALQFWCNDRAFGRVQAAKQADPDLEDAKAALERRANR